MDYLIVYNQQQNLDLTELHDTIRNLPVSDWWHYLPNVYIVRSTHTAKTLADGIIARNPGLLFLLIKVDLSKTSGVLNKSAWDWINNKARTVFKLKSAPTPKFLGRLPSLTPQVNLPSIPPSLSDILKRNR